MVRDQKITDKTGKEHRISVLVYGLKLGVLYDRRSGIPVAAKVVPIHEHESNLTLPLVEQAQKNLKGHSRVVKILEDRGFLDGPTLYALDRQGILFVVPGKENLRVTADARGLAQKDLGAVRRRVRTEFHGSGRKRHKEELVTEVVGIADLQTFDTYNDHRLPDKPIAAITSPSPSTRWWSGSGITRTSGPAAKWCS